MAIARLNALNAELTTEQGFQNFLFFQFATGIIRGRAWSVVISGSWMLNPAATRLLESANRIIHLRSSLAMTHETGARFQLISESNLRFIDVQQHCRHTPINPLIQRLSATLNIDFKQH
ncbi:MAG: hypothetical protein MUF49_05565 [Oculatellaceae cyanobacterium Prado106]|jgi:hypothetical protein|nr:hypothetical protein [Oculatellaceae cyanobacterium Prado106]